ncbi:MAG: RagB/SusD family nutrient uptake outer membrane protein [Agriterribacter sp.]
MKNSLITGFLIIILQAACIKDTLNRKPLNLISDEDVWTSEQMLDIYLIPLYDAASPGYLTFPYLANITDESSYYTPASVAINNFGNYSLALNTTAYSWIRQANYFLEKINTATIPEASIKRYIAECRFIRAFYYFDLVKKYGGMPIIKDVQTFNNNLGELQVSRNKEEEVYDFILEELNAVIADLPDSWSGNNANRATKMAAQALKSRAMLYAGSIARYGAVQLNGLIGIPPAKANTYFTESMNASKAIMESNKFGLYDKLYNPASQSGDPVKNYQDIFLDKNNKEVIFQKAYSFPDKPHDLDHKCVPQGYITSYGSTIAPTLEMVESYEYKDGTPGTLNVDGLEFDSPDDLFKDKDPRFTASVFRSGTPYIGSSLEIYRGIYDTDGTLYSSINTPFPKDVSKNQVGRSGPYEATTYSRTGFYMRKLISNTNIITEPNFSDQNYIIFRYAEILLNYAEAALESGTNLPEALTAINLVRSRGGIKPLTAGELTINRLRNERKVELAFEDSRFWDIRRWRIGSDLFKSTNMHGLYPYLKYTGSGYKYIFKKITGDIDGGKSRIWEEKDNYSNLSGYISTNNKIINNPGW